MTATNFRAYAFDNGVHNPVNEGAVADGAAKFTADQEIAYVTFHGGENGEVCLGRVDGPFAPGELNVALADE